MKPPLFDRIGGDALRALIADFYDRVFRDVMIGFMFEGKNKQHLIDREWELAAALLGAKGVTYTGRPMPAAHAQHTIFGGHFERRKQLMRETMRDHGVDPEIQQVWLDHTEALRSQITRDRGSECKDTSSAEPPPPVPDASEPSGEPVPWGDKPIKLGRR